jgi:hypothetical protein
MSYVRDPGDTVEPPCFCDLDGGPVLTTEEFCPAHGDSEKFPPEPEGGLADDCP